MNKEPAFKIGQELKNTLALGDCTILDIFYSVTSNRYVYLVEETGKPEFNGVYLEEDLQEDKDNWTSL